MKGEVTKMNGESVKKAEGENVFRANLVIEGAGDAQDIVEKQMVLLEQKLRKEPYSFSKIDKSSVEKIETTYCMFLDVDVAVPHFRDLIYLIITYGPSSVELVEPNKVELSLHDAQDLLNSIVSTVHYYVSYILQLHMQKNKQSRDSAAAHTEEPAKSEKTSPNMKPAQA